MLSEEQELASSAKDRRIIINSVAGSGKTTVAKEIIRKNKNSKVLYLVYNKSMQLEALDRFYDMSNVEIRTTYSMAYAAYGHKYKHRLTYGFNLYSFASLVGTNDRIDPGLQRTELFLNLFEEYLSSRFYTIRDFLEDRVNSRVLSSTENIKGISALLERVFSDLENVKERIPIPHQFYFKLWHLSKPRLEKYDIVIVDEYQDSSAALVDIIDINTKVKRIVVIGDENQNIYGFANTINGLAYHKNWTTYNLSTSYRVSNKLAKLLEKYISETKCRNFCMIGENKNNKIRSSIPDDTTHYRICRFNDSIIKDAIIKASEGKIIYIEGGLASIDFSYFREVYDFAFTGKKSKRLSRFSSLDHLKAYARKTKDINSIRALKLISTYGEQFKEKIRTMRSMLVDDEGMADVCYTTAHKSKGKTIDIPVIVDNDFYNAMEDNPKVSDIDQEINVLHVACTRGCDVVVLPTFLHNMLKDHVDEEWVYESEGYDEYLDWGISDNFDNIVWDGSGELGDKADLSLCRMERSSVFSINKETQNLLADSFVDWGDI